MVACEEVVKKQYSLLGWEYKDTHSDDDDNITDCGKMHIICKCTIDIFITYVFKSHNLTCTFHLCRAFTSIPT